MFFNGKKSNKNYYNKQKRNFNGKNFLNNKKYRQKEENKNNIKTKISAHNQPETDQENQGNEYTIPGFYYDKEKNRYFPLKDKEILKEIKEQQKQQNKNENENEKEIKGIQKSISRSNNLSYFNMIHSSRNMETNVLKNLYNRTEFLKNSNYIEIQYEGDKFPNNIYSFYKKKYLLVLDYFNDNNVSTTITIHDIVNNKFIKKLIIEEFYNDMIIIQNNLILIDNITKLSIINNINEVIESRDKKIIIDKVDKFEIKIKNIDRITMVYKWPFIKMENNTYYYLVWNHFYYFYIDNNLNKKEDMFQLIKHNNEILYLPKNELKKGQYIINLNKVNINKKYHYINFLINKDKKSKNNFYFFTSEGEIHRYKFKKNNIFILKQIISNELLVNNPIIEICNYYNNNFMIISNKSFIFNLDLLNQTMTEINNDISSLNDNKSIKFKMKIFEYNKNLNCIIYEEDDNIIIFSLDDFSLIKKFKINYYNYNILMLNNEPKII